MRRACTKDVMSSSYSRYSNTFLASIHEISQRCTKPEEVLEGMKHTMKQTIKLVHARYVVDLLQDLEKRGIGTNSVEMKSEKAWTFLKSLT